MSFPFWILLIPYGLLVSIFLIMSGFGIYHCWRFGFRSAVVHSVVAAYLAATVVILILSIIGITTLDWSGTWDIGGI